MEQALRAFQPACVVCGTTDDLTTDHIRPLDQGEGKQPGNAVRLCRACNSFKSNRNLNQLTPEMARKLEVAATQFKEFWESSRAISTARAVSPPEESPAAPDPTLVALLRAVERGDDTAVSDLSIWLEEQGDPRSASIREVARLQPIVSETWTEANEVRRWVSFVLDGKNCGVSWAVPTSSEDTEESLAHHVREFLRRQQGNEVWQRLGLTQDDANALRQYLGLGPMGAMSARQAGKAAEAPTKRRGFCRSTSKRHPDRRCPHRGNCAKGGNSRADRSQPNSTGVAPLGRSESARASPMVRLLWRGGSDSVHSAEFDN